MANRETVGKVMRHCCNYFDQGYRKTAFSITGGVLTDSSGAAVTEREWVAIIGSFNYDGVWYVGEGGALTDWSQGMPDETFTGKIHYLAPPVAFLSLCDEIAEYAANNPVGGGSVRIGQYSESGVKSWQEAFGGSGSGALSLWMRNPVECDIRV